MILRGIVEMSVTGQRRGFAPVAALLAALRTEEMAMQTQLYHQMQQREISKIYYYTSHYITQSSLPTCHLAHRKRWAVLRYARLSPAEPVG